MILPNIKLFDKIVLIEAGNIEVIIGESGKKYFCKNSENEMLEILSYEEIDQIVASGEDLPENSISIKDAKKQYYDCIELERWYNSNVKNPRDYNKT